MLRTRITFRTHFDDLRRAKGLREQRDITITNVSEETGLTMNTLRRLRTGGGNVNLNTLAVLMQYFGITEISDLIEYVPDTSS